MNKRLYISTEAPYLWTLIDGHNVLDNGISEELDAESIPFDQAEMIFGVIKAEQVGFYRLEIPVKKRKYLESALEFALDEEVATPVNYLHWGIFDWRPGEYADVVVIDREKISAWLSDFETAGVILDDIISEAELIPLHASAEQTIVFASEDRFLVRNRDQSIISLDDSLLDIWWDEDQQQKVTAVNDEQFAVDLIRDGGDNVQYWDIGHNFNDWLNHGLYHQFSRPVLLSGEFKTREYTDNSSLYKQAAAIIVAGIVLYVVGLFGFSEYLNNRNHSLDQQVVEKFESIFGEDSFNPDEDAWFQLRSKVAQAKSGRSLNEPIELLALLMPLSDSLVTQNQKLQQIEFKDNELYASANVESFEDLNAVIEDMKQKHKDITITIDESQSENGKVSGVYKLNQ